MGKKNRTRSNKQNTSYAMEKIIDEKLLAHEIVKAYEEAERYRNAEKEKQEKKEREEWLRFLNQKKYPLNEKWFLRKYHEFRNDFFGAKKLLFIKKEEVRDIRATFGLLRLAVIGIFSLCKWILYGCAAGLIYCVWNHTVELALGATIAIVLWVFARIFRIAAFEIESIQDGNLIIALFSGVLSFVAVVTAIVAIIVDKV